MARTVVESFRVTKDEAVALKRRAALLGLSVSELIRRAAFEDVQPDFYRVQIGDGSPMIFWDERPYA